MKKEIDTLKNPADIVDGKIAESHRQIAKEFAEDITKQQACVMWKYFQGDIVQMGIYFTYKFNSYYMLWTPINDRNVFISEWLCAKIIDKVTDENYYLNNMNELSERILAFIDEYAGVRPDWDGSDMDDKYTSPDAYEMIVCAELLSRKERPIRCHSEWGSGGYKPYDSEQGKLEHDLLVKEILKLRL